MADKPPKTKAREIADEIEHQAMRPNARAAEKYIEGTPDENVLMKVRRAVTGAPLLLGASGADMVSYPFRKKRSEEELNELAREVSKGMKKGGKVRTASQRADGCCIRGKTRA
jgi:hypothetical protein